MSRVDEILRHIGDFGKFQQRIYVLLSVLTTFHCCQIYLLVFLADIPEWECSEKESVFLDVKTKHGRPCYQNGSVCHDIDFKTEYSSIATEWKLICNQEYKTNLAQAIIMSGRFVGAIAFGGMADKYGRKFAIISIQAMLALVCFGSALAQSYNQFVVLRFLTTATLTGSKTTIFVLLSEVIGPRLRDRLLTAYHGFYASGFVVLALLAYFIRDWRCLTLVISLPFLIFSLFQWRSVCESPQWLLENGRIQEGKEVLKGMAKGNGIEIQEEYLKKLSEDHPKGKLKDSQSFLSIFTAEGNLMKISVLAVAWLLITMLYSGLSFASKSTGGNKYITFSLSGLVEIPSLTLSTFLIKSGRKKPLVNLAVTGAIACFVCCWLNGSGSQASYFITLSAMLGKSTIAASDSIIYIFSAEMFPAKVRSLSMGIFTTLGRVGGIFAPLVVSLELYDKRLPMFVFGVTAMCFAVLVMLLPETLPVIKREELQDLKKD